MRRDGGVTVDPGLLRHSIVWQQKVVASQNAFGEDVYDWQDVLSCRAQVRSLSGMELQSAQQRWAESQYGILQYYSPGLATTMRISWNDNGTTRYLDVLNISDKAGTRRRLDVIAKEWVP